jgi:hypothetical protein
VAKYALLAGAALGLGVAGWEGRRLLVGTPGQAAEVVVQATPGAVEYLKTDEPRKVSMRVESAYVTSGGVLLLNSRRNYKDADNLVIAVPTGSHAVTRETKGSVVGRVFQGEVTRSSFNGRLQLTAVPSKFEIK